jgi:hypothetical protein
MENISAEDEWKVTANRYVAYFDIMGFKDMVLRKSHEEIYAMMKIIGESVQAIKEVWDETSSKLIRTTNYSDSIIIYSKDDSPDSLEYVVMTVAAITSELIENAIPHKGALAFGTMTLDMRNSIFFGQPLIDAYLLQEELHFYGVVIHATAEKEIVRVEKTNNKKIALFAEECSCPFKNGNSSHLIVIPFFLTKEAKYQKECKKLLESFKILRLETSGQLRKYVDNTESCLMEILNRNP